MTQTQFEARLRAEFGPEVTSARVAKKLAEQGWEGDFDPDTNPLAQAFNRLLGGYWSVEEDVAECDTLELRLPDPYVIFLADFTDGDYPDLCNDPAFQRDRLALRLAELEKLAKPFADLYNNIEDLYLEDQLDRIVFLEFSRDLKPAAYVANDQDYVLGPGMSPAIDLPDGPTLADAKALADFLAKGASRVPSR